MRPSICIDVLSQKVSSLIQRSGCSLNTLGLENVTLSGPDLTTIIYLSPSLTELYIRHIPAESLRWMTFKPGVPNLIMPNLKKLHIFSGYWLNELGDWVVPLMEMLWSRTEALKAHLNGSNSNPGLPYLRTLESIDLRGYQDTKLWSAIASWASEKLLSQPVGLPVQDEAVGGAVSALAEEVRAGIERYIHVKQAKEYSSAAEYFKVCCELNKSLKRLEDLDLETSAITISWLQVRYHISTFWP